MSPTLCLSVDVYVDVYVYVYACIGWLSSRLVSLIYHCTYQYTQ